MAPIVHAARMGDDILHPSLAAELISAVAEAAVYAAATAVVASAITLAAVGTVATGGALGVVIGIAAGAAVGAVSGLPADDDTSIGGVISDTCDAIGNAMVPPEVYGKVVSGSKDTFVNGKPAARAAGIAPPAGGPDGAGQAEQAAPSVLENVSGMAQVALEHAVPLFGMVKGLYDAVEQIVNPPIAAPAAEGSVPKEQDKVACTRHPPMPETYIAQGSDKVRINGQPAARSGDKTTCDARLDVNAKVSPNVRVGGGTVTVRNVHSGKSRAAQITGILAGILISRRVKFRPRALKSKAPLSLFRHCKGNPVIVSTGSKVLDGPEDLDFALPGLLGIDWARSYDSNDRRTGGLFGQGWSVPYEVELVRVAHPEGGELWIYIDEEGNRLELGRLKPGDSFVSLLDGLAFFHLDDGQTVVEDINEGRYQVFQTDPLEPSRSRLVRLGDRNLNVLGLTYDELGRLHSIEDTYGQTAIELHYDQPHPQRVARISRRLANADHTHGIEDRQTLVSYRYTPSGHLHEVRDAVGQVVRRFGYTAEGYLNLHQLPSGAVREYQWARFAVPATRPAPRRAEGSRYQMPALLEPQPDHEWRVTRHWGSDGEAYRFEYDLARGETCVTDSLGRQDRYYWGPLYEVYKYVDPLGNCWQEEIIAGQLVKSVDPQGGEWHYTYDAIGRLVGTRDPLGRCEHIAYLQHWALPVHISDRAGGTHRYRYDSQGNLLWEQDPLGHKTHYRYDPEGRVVQVIDALGKHKRLSWNAQGQLLSYRDCSDSKTLYRYDPQGRLSERIDPRGEQIRYRYDARGYLSESERPDGRIDRYTIDAAGQLIRYTDPAQATLHWRYDGSGRLIERQNAMGGRVRFQYDVYGRLLQLTNENDEAYRFAWDELDRLIVQQDLDGSTRTYTYNRIGDVTTLVHQPAPFEEPPLSANMTALPSGPLRYAFDCDAMGRLLRKTTDDGVTDYCYDAADHVLSIRFTAHQGGSQQLDYRYDERGQLLSETNSAGLLQYHHDELGNLQTLTLPDQRKVNHLYYGSGHLHQINLDGRVVSDFERDRGHDEVLRTQGRLLTRTAYDSNGRPTGKALRYRDARPEIRPLLSKTYGYDAQDNLIIEALTQTQRVSTGETGEERTGDLEQLIGRFHDLPYRGMPCDAANHYGYDASEHLQAVQQSRSKWPAAQIERYRYDKAGNLTDGASAGGLVKHNRVHAYQDKRYRYDRFGRLCEKRSAGNPVQRFAYDAEHRLVRVEQTRGGARERIVFSYDPLGRRISKEVYRNDYPQPISRVLFHWQGLRLLGEEQNGLPSLYLYTSPDSHEPLARLDGEPGQEEIQYFHTNLAGLPEQLTDEQGTTLWCSDFQGWGVSKEEWHSPRHSRQQNLRYQGQYLDRETGLHYNTFRFYDPEVGRFTQPDPISLIGGINLYEYAANPINWIDPLGLIHEFGVAGYGSPVHAKDGLTAHELLQNAWLRNNGLVKGRMSGIATTNPAIALQENAMHKNISKLQARYGLHKPSTLKRQTALQNINRNTALTRSGIYNDLVKNRGWEPANAKAYATQQAMNLRDHALQYARNNGLIKCQ